TPTEGEKRTPTVMLAVVPPPAPHVTPPSVVRRFCPFVLAITNTREALNTMMPRRVDVVPLVMAVHDAPASVDRRMTPFCPTASATLSLMRAQLIRLPVTEM